MSNRRSSRSLNTTHKAVDGESKEIVLTPDLGPKPETSKGMIPLSHRDPRVRARLNFDPSKPKHDVPKVYSAEKRSISTGPTSNTRQIESNEKYNGTYEKISGHSENLSYDFQSASSAFRDAIGVEQKSGARRSGSRASWPYQEQQWRRRRATYYATRPGARTMAAEGYYPERRLPRSADASYGRFRRPNANYGGGEETYGPRLSQKQGRGQYEGLPMKTEPGPRAPSEAPPSTEGPSQTIPPLVRGQRAPHRQDTTRNAEAKSSQGADDILNDRQDARADADTPASQPQHPDTPPTRGNNTGNQDPLNFWQIWLLQLR